MASENKTVAEIAKEMRAKSFGEECCPDCGADFQRSNEWPKYADSIEAAHKREIIEAVKPIEANYEFMLKQFADREEQYVRCRIELNDARKNLDECKAELEKARENGKQMWLNALHNSTSKSELHQMLMQAVQEKYKEALAAKDREIAGLRGKMGDDDLLKMARDIDKFRAKLKVAEDALKPWPSLAEWLVENSTKLGISDMVSKLRERSEEAKNALAAIRREREEDDK